MYLWIYTFVILEDEEKSAKKFRKDSVDYDAGDSSSSEESIPLSQRRETSSNRRKAEVLSKLFPRESGKIGVTITTSPTSSAPKLVKEKTNKVSPDVTQEVG